MTNSNSTSSNIDASASLSDIDDKLLDQNKQQSHGYTRPGTFFQNADAWLSFGNAILTESSKSAGNGGYTNILQNFLTRLDRHGTAIVPLNSMNYGYTFITRPRLNMLEGNLRQHPILANLIDPSGGGSNVASMIRGLLDTCLSRGLLPSLSQSAGKVDEVVKFYQNMSASGLFDVRNPFFTPLCNGLKGISGFPDLNLETATMGEDFYSGDFTFLKGAELFNRTQELSLEFRDVQGSIILSCIFYWCLMMALQTKNICMAYPDDIYEQRLNYTVSIYRFITDHTRRNILWWCKATGCFPKSAPIGSLFNVNQGEVTITAAQNFSIPFTANCIEYNDPGIIFDFRTLIRRYVDNDNGGFDKWVYDGMYSDDISENASNYATANASYNFMGLPDIIDGPQGLQLVWKYDNNYNDNIPDSDRIDVEAAQEKLNAEREALINSINATTSTSTTTTTGTLI